MACGVAGVISRTAAEHLGAVFLRVERRKLQSNKSI